MTPPIVAQRDDVVLAMTGISKAFGATAALVDVSFAVRRGTVHALVGENGAGKTTLMRIAFGLIAPDEGTVTVAGSARSVRSAVDAIASRVGMVHQHFTNVPAMTVAENVALGGRGRFNAKDAAQRVRDIGTRTGLVLDPNAIVSDLAVGAQQRLEIVKALAHDARLLILDEPTAVLAPAEVDDLLRWVRGYADAGNAVVLMTHKLPEALAVADDVTVLRRGRLVQSVASSALTPASLAALLLGDEGELPTAAAHERSAGEVVASLADVAVVDDRGLLVLRGASVDVRAGEIVGVAAVEGAGQRQLLRVLAGRQPAIQGTIRLPASIGFVPEDRHRDALVLDFSVTENVALRGAGARRGRMRWGALRARAAEMVRAFDVRGARSVASRARALSGGNQQKLVLAREIDGSPPLLVVENPTRGLDIRAAALVHERLRMAAAAGAGVVAYSSDLDEVFALGSRILVVHAGRVLKCPRDRDVVGRAMLGVS